MKICFNQLDIKTRRTAHCGIAHAVTVTFWGVGHAVTVTFDLLTP